LIDLLKSALELSRTSLAGMDMDARTEIHDKHVVDITTKGDRGVSDVLTAFFLKSGFSAVVLSEESGKVDLCSDPQYTVTIDDIDGTDNFFRGGGLLPYCTIISILSGTKPSFADTVAAGIIEHRTGALWLAEKGKGCLFQGVAAHTSQKSELNRRTLVTIDHYGSSHELTRLYAIHSQAWIKDFGSAGFHLAGVASGMFDAYLSTAQKGHEIAAGYLLIREAGGCVFDMTGQRLDTRTYDFNGVYDVVASGTESLARHILALLRPGGATP
jgi:myo-inositol-1(or 4)-monophosphatase